MNKEVELTRHPLRLLPEEALLDSSIFDDWRKVCHDDMVESIRMAAEVREKMLKGEGDGND